MVEVWLPYGSSEVPARIPEERLVEIIKPQKVNAVLDASSETGRLVQSNRNLQEMAKKASRVYIVLGATSKGGLMIDITKSLVQSLTELGVAGNSITILCIPDAPHFDSTTLPETKILRHNPLSSPTVAIDEFKGDFSLSLNSVLVGEDLKILLGELRLHHFVGYSGLSDMVFPGLASESSALSQLSNRKPMAVLDMYRERIEIADSIRNLLALGFVLDADQSPAKLSLGSIRDCIDDLKGTAQDVCSRKINRLADIVVMSAGGRPTDESLLRAVETFPTGLAALKREGAMIVAAECAMGHGDREFYEWCAERKEPRHLETRLRHSFNYQGFKAAFLLRALENHRIYLVSTVPDHYVENVFGMRAARTVNSALQTVQRSLGSDSTISVIPDASSVILQQT